MLELRLLGLPQVSQQNKRLTLERRKALALLAYLAVQNSPQGVGREHLASLLFEDAPPDKALAYLRNALWTLNKTLGEGYLLQEGEQVRLNVSQWQVDVWDFERAFNQTERTELERAARLYDGEFMAYFSLPDASEWQAWQTSQSQAYQLAYQQILRKLAHAYADVGEYSAALEWVQKWLSVDELNEAAHRLAMSLYAWEGQATAALRQFRHLESLLQRELGVKPDICTQQLLEDILADQHVAPEQKRVLSSKVSLPMSAPPRLQPQLPSVSTPFIGRTEELDAIISLLNTPACRLLSLVGQGGIGKTRLALQTLERLGGWAAFVSLAPVTSPEFIMNAIAQGIGFVLDPRTDSKHQLFQVFSTQGGYLVLDNFEHLLEGAGLVSELLSRAPDLKIIVTSRERLGLAEEWLYELGGLSYPRLSDTRPPQETSAFHLFVTTARRQRPNFQTTDEDVRAIAHLCRLVEGMPLALELAAAWVQVLSPAEIAQELERNLDILSTPLRHLPERHRSLRVIFEQAWARLSAHEQSVLARLSVLASGFSSEAAQAIAGASFHQLLSLSQQALLRRNAAGRYEIHELLRQYAYSKLDADSQQAAQIQHSAYYLRFLSERASDMRGARAFSTLEELSAEMNNVRAAWLCSARIQDVSALRQAFVALSFYLNVRGGYRESKELFERAIEGIVPLAQDDASARALLGLLWSGLAFNQQRGGRPSEIPPMVEQAIQAIQSMPPSFDHAYALCLCGQALSQPAMPYSLARELLNQSYGMFEQLGDKWGMAQVLYAMGNVDHMHIRYQLAEELAQRSLTLFQHLGYAWGILNNYWLLARNSWTLGNFPQARRWMELSSPIVYALGNRSLIAEYESSLMWYLERGNITEQLDLLRQNAVTLRQQEDWIGWAWTQYEIATVYFFTHDYSAANAVFEEILLIFSEHEIKDGVCWSNIFMAWGKVYQGKYEQVDAHLSASREVFGDWYFPWGVAGAEFVRGELAQAQGRWTNALSHYRQAVKIAHDVQSMSQLLRHMTGIGAVWMHYQRRDDALRLWAFIAKHAASSKDALDQIQRYRHVWQIDDLSWQDAQAQALMDIQQVVKWVLS